MMIRSVFYFSLATIALVMPLHLGSTSCAVSHYRNFREITAGEPLIFQVADAGARSWKWSAKLDKGAIFTVKAGWIGDSNLVALSSARFNPGHQYDLLINGKDACDYLCSEQDKHFRVNIAKSSTVARNLGGVREAWMLESVQLDAEGSNLTLEGRIGVHSEKSYYIARIEGAGVSGGNERRYEAVFPARNETGNSSVHVNFGLCSQASSLIKHGGSYKLTLFRAIRGRFVKTAGWTFSVPEREGFSAAELAKIKEYDRLYSEYLGDVGNQSKNDALINWKTNNKDLNEKYVAAVQKPALFQAGNLGITPIPMNQIADLNIIGDR